MNVIQELFDNYYQYQVSEITTNRFSPGRFQEVLQLLVGEYQIKKLGESVEGRIINSITLGSGPVKVLLWSQMHGNESTATRAILDILNFMNVPKELAEIQKQFLSELTICIVPMVNPDGATEFKRRNSLNIDINRDAREFESPESQILKGIITDFKPDFAFNLHDQRRFYNITGSSKPSTIAFLAPAFDELEAVNPTRGMAMQVIAHLRHELEAIIPGQVGLYDDTFTPRAFGDYCQRTGASTILVESGWERDDMEKEFVRKLNFCLLVSSFHAIASKLYNKSSVEDYMSIPMNDERLFDLLIRNVAVEKNEKYFKYDIGIQRTEERITKSTTYYSVGEVSDIGDLNGWYGFNELNESDLLVSPGMVWPQPFADLKEINKDKACEMAKQGYLYVEVKENCTEAYISLPINLVKEDFSPDVIPEFEGKANFVLKTAEDEIKYVVINGFLWKLDEPMPNNINGLVL